MLTYHQSYDIYHYIFRVLRLLKLFKRPIEFDYIKLVDFYSLFPKLTANISLTLETQHLRKLVSTIDDRFMRIESGKRQFLQMEHLYNAALDVALYSGLIIEEDRKILLSSNPAHSEFLNSISVEALDDISVKIAETLSTIPLEGKNGLKQRSGMMEYRYHAE